MNINFHHLLNNVPGAVFRCACDCDWTMLYLSDGITELTGYAPSELMNNNRRSFASLIHESDAAQVEYDVFAAIDERRSWDIEYRLLHRDGSFRWVHECGVAIVDSGTVRFLDGFVMDISERKSMQNALRQSEQRVREMAYYDSVTKLPNRNLVFENIESSIIRAVPFCLYFIDLNDFKPINDQFGHACGDQLLAKVGAKIRLCVDDDGVVGRVGRDEFLVLYPNGSLLSKVARVIRQPLSIEGNVVRVTASIGMSQFPEHGSTVGELVRAADSAMYSAKHSGNDVCVFSKAA